MKSEKNSSNSNDKKRLWHRCFLLNFAKVLGTPFFYRKPPVAASVVTNPTLYFHTIFLSEFHESLVPNSISGLTKGFLMINMIKMTFVQFGTVSYPAPFYFSYSDHFRNEATILFFLEILIREFYSGFR